MNRKYLAVVSAVLIMLGSYLAFILPGQLANKELHKAQINFTETKKAMDVVSNEIAKMDWYKKEYVESIKTLANKAQQEVNNVSKELVLAEKANGAKEKRSHAEFVNKELFKKDGAAVLLKSIRDTLEAYRKMTVDARSRLGALQKSVADAKKKHYEISSALKKEAPQYLSKYVKMMSDHLDQSEKNLNQLDEMMKRQISVLLPAEEDRNSSGDPKEAIKLLDRAVVIMGSASNLIALTAKEISFQREALVNAEPGVIQAEGNLKNACKHLESVVAKTALLPTKALKNAFQKKTDAQNILAQAKKALANKAEGNKRDLALAYKKALEVSDLSGNIIAESDRQVKMANDSAGQIVKLKEKLRVAHDDIERSERSRQILAVNHASSEWREVADNMDSSKRLIFLSEQLLVNAETASREQLFSDSLEASKKAIVQVEKSITALSDLRDHAEQLEQYRRDWPDVERRANETISSEKDNVERYGSYSSSAESDFEDAIDALRQARSAASRREFETAVDKARKAIGLADGAGQRAYAAYEDEQRRREEEESRSSDSDFGGSSSGGSVGGSVGDYGGSDAGGYSGGSSSSDGGGFGGSSRSSDGGGWE